MNWTDEELIENAKAIKKAFTKQQKQSVLQMDLMDFLEENIAEKSLRTRAVNWIYRYHKVRTVGELVKYCQDYKYAHPLLTFRYIGRDCEKVIIGALEKYDIYLGHPIDNNVDKTVEKPAKRLEFIDYNTSIELASWNGWRSEIPQVGDLVCFPNDDSDNIVWIIKQRCFYKNGLIVFDCVEPNRSRCRRLCRRRESAGRGRRKGTRRRWPRLNPRPRPFRFRLLKNLRPKTASARQT